METQFLSFPPTYWGNSEYTENFLLSCTQGSEIGQVKFMSEAANTGVQIFQQALYSSEHRLLSIIQNESISTTKYRQT